MIHATTTQRSPDLQRPAIEAITRHHWRSLMAGWPHRVDRHHASREDCPTALANTGLGGIDCQQARRCPLLTLGPAAHSDDNLSGNTTTAILRLPTGLVAVDVDNIRASVGDFATSDLADFIEPLGSRAAAPRHRALRCNQSDPPAGQP